MALASRPLGRACLTGSRMAGVVVDAFVGRLQSGRGLLRRSPRLAPAHGPLRTLSASGRGDPGAVTTGAGSAGCEAKEDARSMVLPRRILAALRSQAPPRPPLAQIVGSGVAAAACIAALAVPLHFDLLENGDIVMLLGSFGASACIVGGAHSLAVAQPRNVIGGHVISAAVGLSMFELELATGEFIGMWITAPLGAGIATAAMLATRTFHPPAAGTALIALMGSPAIHALGWWFLVTPALTGPIILCAAGALTNRVLLRRDYPTYWW